MTARRWWLAPEWIRGELAKARINAGAVKRAYEVLNNRDTDYARSIAVMVEVRAAIVKLLEEKLAEADR